MKFRDLINEELVDINEGHIELLENLKEFTPSMIKKLKKEYGKIKTIDPDTEAYKKFEKFMNSLDDDKLKQLRDAKIKWLSMKANAILTKKGINEEDLTEGKNAKALTKAITATLKTMERQVDNGDEKGAKNSIKSIEQLISSFSGIIMESTQKKPKGKVTATPEEILKRTKKFRMDSDVGYLLGDEDIILSLTHTGMDWDEAEQYFKDNYKKIKV